MRAPDFRLRNEDGDPVLDEVPARPARGGHVPLHDLPDSCPIQAQTIRGALDQLGHDVPALAIAVDPPPDTPERAQAFLRSSEPPGASTSCWAPRRAAPVWKGFGSGHNR